MSGAVIGTIVFIVLAIVACIGIGQYVMQHSPNRMSKLENRK